jgi:hypothetical protein
MPSKKKTSAKPESERQADWIRKHPTAEGSSFPEYPDEIKRRGASRGALPIGNPWGPDPSTRDTVPQEFYNRPTVPGVRVVDAPPKSPAPAAMIRDVVTGVDARIAEQIGARLAESKAFDDHPIELRVHEGEVELGGVVLSKADTFEAAHLASSVRGVIRVVNHLRVQRNRPAKSTSQR